MTPTERQKLKRQKKNNLIAWLSFIGGVLVIFVFGALFGYHLTRHSSQTTNKKVVTCGQAEIKRSIEFSVNSENDTAITEVRKAVPGLPLDYELQATIYESCQKYNVPFALALAVAEKESGFDPDAKSNTDDYGIMQINRCNFEYLCHKGIDPLTYEGNIEAGVMLLGENLTRYGDEGLAVMAYNCGRTGAKRLWDAGVYSTSYSRATMKLYEKWRTVPEVKQ